MSTVYILQNQHHHFLSKQGEWVNGRDANCLYKTALLDEALNQSVEVSSKDYTLRVSRIECEVNQRGVPIIDPALLPELPMAPSIDEDTDRGADAENCVDADSKVDTTGTTNPSVAEQPQNTAALDL